MTPWQLHVERWSECQDCILCTQRDRIVLARGKVPCDVLLIGEAPGDSENVIGQPFVGPAGKLLDQIVERSVPPTLRVAMTNLVACFPKEAKEIGTNEPEDAEILACRRRLTEFIAICRPRLTVTVGKLADQWLPPDERERRSTVTIVHPAAVLRMPLAQQGFAVQKCIVVIATAVENMEALPCSQPK